MRYIILFIAALAIIMLSGCELYNPVGVGRYNGNERGYYEKQEAKYMGHNNLDIYNPTQEQAKLYCSLWIIIVSIAWIICGVVSFRGLTASDEVFGYAPNLNDSESMNKEFILSVMFWPIYVGASMIRRSIMFIAKYNRRVQSRKY